MEISCELELRDGVEVSQMAGKVRDAMAKSISTARPTDTVRRVAQLMREEDAGFIPVCDGDALVGVVTDRDLVVRCLAQDDHENPAWEPVASVLSHSPLTIDADKDLEVAAELMGRAGVRRLPVTEDGRLVGVLSHGNLVQATRGEQPAVQATVAVTRGA
jgi:CBS domain-containing protein